MAAMTHCTRPVVVAVVVTVLAFPWLARAQDLKVMVKMRDGIKLATDIYLPKKAKAPWPALLIRTPYDKKNQKAAGALYSSYGIMVVAQDMRGKYASQGKDMVFTTDGDGALKDGHDTMSYIVKNKSFNNGLIATMGSSALGIVQYMGASASPPGLKLLNAGVATPNLYQDGIFYGGVFRHSMVTGWLKNQGSSHFLLEVAKHPFEDTFWASVQTKDQYQAVKAAGLHRGGWHDIFIQGTIDAWRGYQHQGGVGAKGQQKLLIGPWTHGGASKVKQGELTFPSNSIAPPSANDFWILLNHHLKLNNPLITKKPADIPAVRYYVMGDVSDPKAPGNVWRTAADWPPKAAAVRYHLQPGGALAEACPPGAGGSSAYTFNTAAPSPTVCGRNLTLAAGPCDQGPKVEGRKDVRVFSTPKLSKAVEVTGRVLVRLWVQIDQVDADLMVRLSDVYPNGKSMLVADGAVRLAARGSTTKLTPLKAGELVLATVDLWSTSIIFNKGHRIRISVTSGNYPRFAVNRANGKAYPASVLGAAKQVKVTLHHSLARASYIELPDPNRAPGSQKKCAAPKGDAGVPQLDKGTGPKMDKGTGPKMDKGGKPPVDLGAKDKAVGSDGTVKADAPASDGLAAPQDSGSSGGDGATEAAGGCNCRVVDGGGGPWGMLLVMVLVGGYRRRWVQGQRLPLRRARISMSC